MAQKKKHSTSKEEDTHHVLVAGASGYLGLFVVRALVQRKIPVRAMVGPCSPPAVLHELESLGAGVCVLDARDPEELEGVFNDITSVVSCMAANRASADKGTAESVDRDANINLMNAAKAAHVGHFVLVATFEGQDAKDTVALHKYKEAAVDHVIKEASKCGMRYTIIRPTAFFKDFTDMPWEALKTPSKKVTVVNKGTVKFNPIHGSDVADYICKRLEDSSDGDKQVKIGGPEVLSFREVIFTAADVLNIPREQVKIANTPLWEAKLLLKVLRLPAAASGSSRAAREGLQFMVYAFTHDSVGMPYGTTTVRQYYEDKLKQEQCLVG